MVRELNAEDVRWTCDPALFDCKSTEDLPSVDRIIGQDRALSALRFGLNIRKSDFNIFVSGPSGTGKTTATKSFVESLAREKPTPPDWCYVNNFQDSYRPTALQLPTGKARELQKAMDKTIEDVRRDLAEAFSSKEYREQRENISKEFNQKKEEVFNQLRQEASGEGLVLQSTPMGLMVLPASDDKPMSDEQYGELTDEQKQDLRQRQEKLTQRVREQIGQLRQEESGLQSRLQEADHEVARYAIQHHFQSLREKYNGLDRVIEYIGQVEEDIVENYQAFKPDEQSSGGDSGMGAALQGLVRRQFFRKYMVNVVVDNSTLQGAPAVLELNPTYNELFGRIEKEAQFGALSTDFTMIKGGSLHRANGGYLIVRIEDILKNFHSWEALKRTLRDGNLVVEDLTERFGFMATRSLRPEPIPLNVKVLVIGEPWVYHLLYRYDPEFKELLKVKADFDTRMERTDDGLKDYAGVISRLCRADGMKHLDGSGLASIVEHSCRLSGDRERLSTLFADIEDLVCEAGFWAESEQASVVSGTHVRKAIEEKVYRSNLIQQRIQELISNGTIHILTDGYKKGEVNGLEVLDLGDFSFGKPTRITSALGMGREGLIDIQREAKLGGPIHTKGVMILSGYLTEKYARSVPLSLSARLVFEQSYEEVEGDSASSTELYSLISALADAPLRQDIAVTGSVNQRGEIQAIGGVNEKVEGFFEVCRAQGLSGQHGVLIPASNARNLMLKEDVADAVREGRFHLYLAGTVDEGIEVLTGEKAGEQFDDGSFEAGTVNDRVQKRLTELAQGYRDFARSESGFRP
ncbi:MAG: AAA family ATPase [Chloroflexota bacterium]